MNYKNKTELLCKNKKKLKKGLKIDKIEKRKKRIKPFLRKPYKKRIKSETWELESYSMIGKIKPGMSIEVDKNERKNI